MGIEFHLDTELVDIFAIENEFVVELVAVEDKQFPDTREHNASPNFCLEIHLLTLSSLPHWTLNPILASF